MWPAMISDSPSGMSKGERLASAVAAIMKRTKPARPQGVKTCQRPRIPPAYPAWLATMAVNDKEPAIITTTRVERMNGIS